MITRVVVAAVTLNLASCLMFSTHRAEAASYEVHACRVPSGAPAPAHGWSSTGKAVASMNCPGGAMTVRAPAGSHGPGWSYGLAFSAPSGTNIAGFRRQVEGNLVQVGGGPPPWAWEYIEGGIFVGEQQRTETNVWYNTGAFEASFEYPMPRRLTQLDFSLRCSESQQSGACQENGSQFTLRRVTVQLDDHQLPQIVTAAGSLTEASGPQRGGRSLTLKLRDGGSGLFRVRVEVDGELLSEHPVDDNQGACERPFVLPVPCKLAATVELSLDTTRLTEGPHSVNVRVLDATGVNAAVFGPIPLVVDNVPGPASTEPKACPSTGVATVRRRLSRKTVAFGRSTSIVGQVRNRRTSLRGARISLVDHTSLSQPPRPARVGRRGRFRIRIRPRTSTRLQPILISASGAPQACGKPVQVRVRAGVRLNTTPRALRNGEAIRMRGKLLGSPVPTGGKIVRIQARALGAAAWTTVSQVLTDPQGRFRFTYRFRRTFQSTIYQFRAVATREHGYPYTRGWSRVRRARVDP